MHWINFDQKYLVAWRWLAINGPDVSWYEEWNISFDCYSNLTRPKGCVIEIFFKLNGTKT